MAHPQLDYREFAAQNARTEFGPKRDELVHWSSFDEPTLRGLVQAVCGATVDVSQISGEPTCPGCQAAMQDIDRYEF